MNGISRILTLALCCTLLIGLTALGGDAAAAQRADPKGAVCEQEGPTRERHREQAIPQLVPAGPPIDRDWPVVHESVEVTTDPASGKPITITTTVRRDPNFVSTMPTASSTSAFSCWNEVSDVVQFSASLGSPAVFSAWSKLYYRRVQAGEPADWVYAYINTRTDVWWTRTSTLYDLSSQSSSWTFTGWRCDQFWDPRSASGGGWLPGWQTWDKTHVYAYFGPMDSWPFIWSAKCCYEMKYAITTDVTESGFYAGTIKGSYVFPKVP